jgi:capsular exopolysaccharide synthesis family protein
MNNLVPAAPGSFSLEMIPDHHREVATATPMEQLLAGAYRQRYIIAGALLVPILIAFALSLMLPRSYTAVASVQLDQQVPRVVSDPDLDPQLNTQDAPRFLQTQLDRVRSRNLAEMVEGRLKLEKSPERMKALGVDPNNPGIIASAKKALGLSSDEPFDARSAVIGALQSGVNAQAGLNTRLAQITFTSADPNVSAQVANAYADALVASNIEAKIRTSDDAKRYLQGQLADAKRKLESSEKAMLAYARAEDLTTTVVKSDDPKNENVASLRDQQLGTLTDSLSQATARRIDAQQSWAQVSKTSPMLLPDVQSNQAIQNLVSQRAQSQAALDEERQRHTDNYPSVREAQAKINQLDAQIGGFAASIKSSYYGRYLAAAKQERQLQGTVGSLKAAAMSERERAVGFNALSREVETAKAFYAGLLQRYQEIGAASGAPSVNVSIVDRAWPPTNDNTSLARNIALGGMAGLVLALLLGAVRERLHQVVRSSEDIERSLGLRSLGVVPRIAKSENLREALADPHSAQSEAYYSIAVALEDAAAGALPKTMLITSSVASEGKSTSAMAIARSLGAMGRRVLVVDGDLRRPSSTKLISHSPNPTFTDVLAGSATTKQLIEATQDEPFSVVPAGNPRCNPVTLLGATGVKSAFDNLAKTYDIVIIDGPPILGLADAVLLARSVESVVLVVEANRTHSSELDLAISRLPRDNLIGAVITKFDAKVAGVRYGGSEYYVYRGI